MLKKQKNKKGLGLIDPFAFLAAVLVTILFIFFFRLSGCAGPPTQRIASEKLTDLKVNYDLMAYLRTPVEYKGLEMTVGDLVVLAMENNQEAASLAPYRVDSLGGLVPVGLASFTMDILNLDILITRINQYLRDVEGYKLTETATNLMKTYAEYRPRHLEGYFFCSFRVIAENDDKIIVFYDARYTWYSAMLCVFQYDIATATIPDYEGNPIEVKIRATASRPILTLYAQQLGIY